MSLKLSSTAFASGAETGPSFSNSSHTRPEEDGSSEAADDVSTTSPTTDDSSFNFDRNGVIIPYFAFVSLMDDANFQQYLAKIVEKYEESEGPLSKVFAQLEANKELDEPEEEEEEDLRKKRKKSNGKRPQPLDDYDIDDDGNNYDDYDFDDDFDLGAVKGGKRKRQRATTPMPNLDFSLSSQVDDVDGVGVSTDSQQPPSTLTGAKNKSTGRRASAKK